MLLQGANACLPRIVDLELEVRCKADSCEWLVWRVQNNNFKIFGGSGRTAQRVRSQGSPWYAQMGRDAEIARHLTPKGQRWGSPGQGNGPELRRGRKSPPQKQPGSVAVGLGKIICLHFDICRMNLFSSNQLTNLLENDTEITSKLV